jgi:hypothetical protein
VEPEMADCLIEITLEPEILELVYVYEPHHPTGFGGLRCGLMAGECILRGLGINLPMGCGIWIRLLFVPSWGWH